MLLPLKSSGLGEKQDSQTYFIRVMVTVAPFFLYLRHFPCKSEFVKVRVLLSGLKNKALTI